MKEIKNSSESEYKSKNFIVKCIERLKKIFKPVIKKVATVTISASLIFAVGATLTACSFTSCGPETPIVNPVDPTDPTNPDPNYSQYSERLQTVLTSSTYNKYLEDQATMSADYNIMNYAAFPYYFLEKENYDVATLKSDTTYLSGSYYTYDASGKLYGRVRVKEPTTKEYYTDYILSYQLSEKEYNDLLMLTSGNYTQSAFFLQELSKDATIVSKANITTTAYEHMAENLPHLVKNIMQDSSYYIDIVFEGYDENSATIGLYTEDKTATIEITPGLFASISTSVINNQTVYRGPYASDSVGGYVITDEAFTACENSVKDVNNYFIIDYIDSNDYQVE